MNAHVATPVFQVSNLNAALKHYIEILGFTEDFRFGDYAGVKLGEACLHLSGHSIHDRPVGGGTAYFFCDEVDAYYAEITGKGAISKAEPKNYDYGMRDFLVVDLYGNHLGFGCEIKGN
jgi:uncharacterized glyoxalase superfamily protein PhnB